MIHYGARAASCTTAGWNEYDACSKCGYSTYVEIPASGHNLIHHDGRAATCTERGWNAYDVCSNCGYTTYAEIPAAGHDLIHHDAQAATCTTAGWNEYDACSKCDYTTCVEIPALGHDLIHYDAKPATTEEFGWKAYDACTRCDYTTYEEIERLPSETAGTVALTARPGTRAPGMTFLLPVTASEVSGTGAEFTLTVDLSAVSLINVVRAEGVEATEEGGTLSVRVGRNIAEGETLLTLEIVVRNRLEAGDYQILSSDASVTYFGMMRTYDWGDVNMDGRISSRDAVLIQQYSVGLYELDDVALALADVYYDGRISSRDAVLIQQYAVHMPVTLGKE